MGEDWGDNNTGTAVDRVTIAEAATLLGVHPNTVRNRVKAGMYRAEKILTENGPTWMIERNSLITNAPTTASQQPVGGVPAITQEALQELARAIVREAGIDRGGDAPASLSSRLAQGHRVLDAMRDYWKIQYDQVKQLGTASGVMLLGLAALVGVFSPDPTFPALVYAAALMLVLALMGSFVCMTQASNVMGEMIDREASVLLRTKEEPLPPLSSKSFLRWKYATLLSFALGAGGVLWFVNVNALPF